MFESFAYVANKILGSNYRDGNVLRNGRIDFRNYKNKRLVVDLGTYDIEKEICM